MAKAKFLDEPEPEIWFQVSQTVRGASQLHKYSRTRLIRNSIFCVHFCLSISIRHTSFYALEAFCSVNTSLVVSLLMSKQVVHVGIQNKLRIFI